MKTSFSKTLPASSANRAGQPKETTDTRQQYQAMPLLRQESLFPNGRGSAVPSMFSLPSEVHDEITQYLSPTEINTLRQNIVSLSADGSLNTLADVRAQFGMKELQAAQLAKSASTISSVDQFKSYLQIASTMPMHVRGNIMRSLIETALTKLPENERHEAWNHCLDAVGKLDDSPVRIADFLSRLAEGIPRLAQQDRIHAFEACMKNLRARANSLGTGNSARVASHLISVVHDIPSPTPLDDTPIIKLRDEAYRLLNENSDNGNLPAAALHRLMKDVRFLPPQERSEKALDILGQLRLRRSTPHLQEILADAGRLVWQIGINNESRLAEAARRLFTACAELDISGKQAAAQGIVDARPNGHASLAFRTVFDGADSMNEPSPQMLEAALNVISSTLMDENRVGAIGFYPPGPAWQAAHYQGTQDVGRLLARSCDRIAAIQDVGQKIRMLRQIIPAAGWVPESTALNHQLDCSKEKIKRRIGLEIERLDQNHPEAIKFQGELLENYPEYSDLSLSSATAIGMRWSPQ